MNGELFALLLALAALAGILALAGTAFAVRVAIILCLGAVAGRWRRANGRALQPVRQ